MMSRAGHGGNVRPHTERRKGGEEWSLDKERKRPNTREQLANMRRSTEFVESSFVRGNKECKSHWKKDKK